MKRKAVRFTGSILLRKREVNTDPFGSYTGVPEFGGMPEQDADDL